jgi:hypothetical protein
MYLSAFVENIKILTVVLYGCDTWTVTLREEQRSSMLGNISAEGNFLPERGSNRMVAKIPQ